MSDSLPTCAMTHSYVRHDSFILWHDSFVRMTRLIHICDMTYSYVWHDSFMSVTWLMHMFAVTNLHVRYDSLICVAWRDYGWDRRTHHMTQWHVWRDWFIRVTWQTDMLYVNRWYARRHPFICVTWLIHLCDVIHPYVWRDSFHVRFNSFVCVTWLVHTHAIIRWYVWHDSFTCVIWPLDVWHDVTWRNYLWDGRTHDMTHWYVWGDECISGTWHDLLNCVWHDAFVCVTIWDDSLLFMAWRMHICDMTRKYNWRKNRRNDLRMTTSSYAWHNEFIRLIEIPKTFISHSWITLSDSWISHLRMSHSRLEIEVPGDNERRSDLKMTTFSCVCYESFIRATRLIRTPGGNERCNDLKMTTFSCVWHDSFIRLTWRIGIPGEKESRSDLKMTRPSRMHPAIRYSRKSAL